VGRLEDDHQRCGHDAAPCRGRCDGDLNVVTTFVTGMQEPFVK
jgi:hypothetical protein